MEWTEKAIIIHVRPFGEGSAIVSALTQTRGLRSGLVKYIKSKAQRGIYQPSYHVELTWKGRQEEQLGFFKAELIDATASRIFHHPPKLQALLTMCAHVHHALPEHESFEQFYDAFYQWLECCTREDVTENADALLWLKEFILLEKMLLEQMGYGMDVSACAATGTVEDLLYLSPKTARAVSAKAGKPYRDKLLALPAFFMDPSAPTARNDIHNGLHATGYFLQKHLYPTNQLPLSRAGVMG
jgi:DNA repair protein RecO (recombination protein O)